MQQVIGKGILRHRFWGEYSAVIAVEFDTALHAHDALQVLGETQEAGKGWRKGEISSNILVWTGNSAELEECTKVLVSFGAEEKKIASVAKSIDYGEPFQVSIPITPREQVSLGF